MYLIDSVHLSRSSDAAEGLRCIDLLNISGIHNIWNGSYFEKHKGQICYCAESYSVYYENWYLVEYELTLQ